MKIVLYIRPNQFDHAELARRHPAHDFVLAGGPEDVARQLPEAELLVTRTSAYDADFVELVKANGHALRWIQLTTSGIDNILKVGGFPKGVTVTNSAGLSAPLVAEHAFALMLTIGHRLRDADAHQRHRDWPHDMRAGMTALFRRTLCIVGLGAIGQQAARRAKAFDMEVIGVSRDYPRDDLVDAVFPRARLYEALARADFVLLATTVTAETVNMIGPSAFDAMRDGTILVNIARGDLIDEDALIDACRSGRLRGAGLDVAKEEPPPADSPLWTLPNVVLTPHIAGGGADTSDILLRMIDDNIRRYTDGAPLRRVCDWESVELPT